MMHGRGERVGRRRKHKIPLSPQKTAIRDPHRLVRDFDFDASNDGSSRRRPTTDRLLTIPEITTADWNRRHSDMSSLDKNADPESSAQRLANFRKLLLESARQAAVANWTSPHGDDGIFNETSSDDDDSSSTNPFDDRLRLLFEGIEYNRATAELGTSFAKAFTALGFITLCINLVILAILVSHKRLVLQQVFYLLIINFAIIDASKGVCLASHALRFVLPPSVYEDRKVLATRIDQYVNIFFRLFNLATIFNLLMITLNEFIYIKFPLRYHQVVRRRLVLILVAITWIISIAFTVTSSVAKSKDDTVFISTDHNETIRGTDSYKSKHVRRTDVGTDGTDLNLLFTFALTGFCVFSLLVVLVCYAVFFKVIREIQKHDRRLYGDANVQSAPTANRRMSEASVECNDLTHLDDRKIKRQLLKRYKYVLVIGSVILVYMLYLISYSSIQILQYFNVGRRSAPMMSPGRMRSMLITRWSLVLLCGLHSTIQPICYFRMREFREIVVRVFSYPCVRCGRRRQRHGSSGGGGGGGGGGDRTEYFSSMADVTPLTTGSTNTPQPPLATAGNVRYSKTAPLVECGQNYQTGKTAEEEDDDQREQIRLPSSLRPPSYANGIRTGGGRQSVVHFEEGTALLVSTLSRRQSGFFTDCENEML